MIPAQLHALYSILQLWGWDEPFLLEKKDEVLSSWEVENEGDLSFQTLTLADIATAYEFLCNYNCKVILCDFGMSENHIGGDDIISFVDSTLKAVVEGYQVHTWYGDDTEVLIIGIKSKDEEPKPFATVTVSINESWVREVIAIINEHDIDDESDKLTIENVRENKPLLDYLCRSLVELDNVGIDIFDIWNQDGFCDWKDFCEFKE